MMTAGLSCNENRHPQKVMKELGITYQISVPQSISDSWEFWNCQNVPDELPKYIEEKHWNPLERIGWGLSQEMAESIIKHQQAVNSLDERNKAWEEENRGNIVGKKKQP